MRHFENHDLVFLGMVYNAIMKIRSRSLAKRILEFLDFRVVTSSHSIFLVTHNSGCVVAMAEIQSNEDIDTTTLRMLKETQWFEDESDTVENPFFGRFNEEILILLDLYESAQ